MIYKSIDKNETVIDIKEILRYAAHKNGEDYSIYSEILKSSIKNVLDAIEPKIIYEYVPIKFEEENVIDFGHFRVNSKNLSKNMKGGEGAIIFAATLGHKLERLLIKSKTDSAALLFSDAAATAMLESVANKAFDILKEEFKAQKKYLRPRFSPGYGDFDLAHQKDIFRVLDLQRRMGMTLTENLFMLPSKSITAVCAVTSSDENCSAGGCEECGKKSTCQFCRI